MIRLLDIKKGFNVGKGNEFIAIHETTLSIEGNCITVLKGPSGSGKTTLLSLIGCMARPTSGRIFLRCEFFKDSDFLRDDKPAEIEVTSLPERFLTEIRRLTFGFIFQQFNLIKGITILENVMLPAYPLGSNYGYVRERAHSLLEAFGLGGRTSARPEWLSGGEAQRVAIARALMNNAPVIIADEPTAHLDSKMSIELMDIISMLKEEGRAAIIASHDPLVYNSKIVDRVISIRDGKVDGETS